VVNAPAKPFIRPIFFAVLDDAGEIAVIRFKVGRFEEIVVRGAVFIKD
jgi:hypothetical protein